MAQITIKKKVLNFKKSSPVASAASSITSLFGIMNCTQFDLKQEQLLLIPHVQ